MKVRGRKRGRNFLREKAVSRCIRSWNPNRPRSLPTVSNAKFASLEGELQAEDQLPFNREILRTFCPVNMLPYQKAIHLIRAKANSCQMLLSASQCVIPYGSQRGSIFQSSFLLQMFGKTILKFLNFLTGLLKCNLVTDREIKINLARSIRALMPWLESS